MMTEAPGNEDPPAYCAVSLPDSMPIIKDDEKKFITPIIEDDSPFEEKNSRNIFALKVLSIFLLQILVETVAMGNVFGFGFGYWRGPDDGVRISMIVTSSLLYLATLAAMVYCDLHVKDRRIYNYIVLVIYPLIIAFSIVSLPALCDNHYYRPVSSLIGMISVAWVSYIVATIAILMFAIFTLNSQHAFSLVACIWIATLVFIVTYLGALPILMYSDINPLGAFGFVVFLYIHYLYVLYDIHKMTARDYRTSMTPDDFVKGAVNLQIDFVFIIRNLILKIMSSNFMGDY